MKEGILVIHPKMQHTYVGIDSHKYEHTAVLINCFFEKCGEIVFENNRSKFDAFLSEASKLKMEGTSLFFGLEDTSSYGRALANFLLKNNQPVKHVNARLVFEERKKQIFTEKDDSIDAECAARILLQMFGTLPDVVEDEKYWLLRTIVVRRKFIINTNVRLKTYLHTLLTQDFPNYRKFFCAIDGKAALAFFTKYPSAGMLKDTTVEELAQFLWENSHGRLDLERAQEILDYTETSLPVHEVRSVAVQSTIRQLQYNLQELEQAESDLADAYDQFDTTLTSMTGIDFITASQFLSCIGDIRKFPTPAKLARYAGVSPVSYSSGRKDAQYANARGNRELNSLFYCLAVRLTVTFEPGHKAVNPFFYDYLYRKMSEGKTKRQALKCVQRRLVNIIWSMLYNNEEYVNPPMISVEKPKED